MSWEDYINRLLSSQSVKAACIIGLDGSLWASSANLKISPVEIKNIISIFDDPDMVAANGVKFNGVKYFFLNQSENAIRVKQGPGGATLAKTNKAIIIGVYASPIQPGQNSKVVEELCDYLRSCNF